MTTGTMEEEQEEEDKEGEKEGKDEENGRDSQGGKKVSSYGARRRRG